MGTRRIQLLHVDDDGPERVLLRDALERGHGGIAVTWVSTGEELEAVLRTTDFDVVLSDIDVAGLKGLEILRKLPVERPDLPVIVSTGKGSEEAAVEAFHLGAADYVPKIAGNVRRLTESIETVVERKRAERRHSAAVAALSRSEERCRRLVEQMPGGLYHLGRNGRFLEVNPAMVEMLGYASKAELRATDFIEDVCVDPADWDCATADGATTGTSTLRLRRKDGSILWVENHFACEPGTNGGPAVVRGIMLDVTERKLKQDGLAASDKEHQALQERLSNVQRVEAIGRLAGGIAHDFNNLLTAVTGYSELLLADMDPGDPKAVDLKEIRKAGERAASLTRQLLAFSRQQVLSVEPLGLNDLIRNIEKLLRRTIGEDIELDATLEPDLWCVEADRSQMDQIVMNLAVNARDAMPQGGRLILETRNVVLDENYAAMHPSLKLGPYVMISVTDTGCGMDEATRARVFEPFFSTKEEGHGHGLGLSTVYGIVKQSGGYIWTYSEPGHGTTFKIYLPRYEGAARPVVGACEETTVVEGGQETVLLVEDDDGVRALAGRVLTQSGYEVIAAAHPAQALELVRTHDGPVDLLLTDLVMPGMSGTDLSHEVAALRPEAKVLYTSGYAARALALNEEVGARYPFLSKPFTKGALLGKVREALGEETRVSVP